ncbi:hypothetical protein V1478_018847 [Vespula squamosa]|uniref:Uncharacterized protein n=1 Tax=Vespula squamosa TaxID=30214 RepID=A0ABD1ZTZ5_VESSQ
MQEVSRNGVSANELCRRRLNPVCTVQLEKTKKTIQPWYVLGHARFECEFELQGEGAAPSSSLVTTRAMLRIAPKGVVLRNLCNVSLFPEFILSILPYNIPRDINIYNLFIGIEFESHPRSFLTLLSGKFSSVTYGQPAPPSLPSLLPTSTSTTTTTTITSFSSVRIKGKRTGIPDVPEFPSRYPTATENACKFQSHDRKCKRKIELEIWWTFSVPMIYEPDLIHLLLLHGMTRLHAVAHANTINHSEYENATFQAVGCVSQKGLVSVTPPTRIDFLSSYHKMRDVRAFTREPVEYSTALQPTPNFVKSYCTEERKCGFCHRFSGTEERVNPRLMGDLFESRYSLATILPQANVYLEDAFKPFRGTERFHRSLVASRIRESVADCETVCVPSDPIVLRREPFRNSKCQSTQFIRNVHTYARVMLHEQITQHGSIASVSSIRMDHRLERHIVVKFQMWMIYTVKHANSV